MNKRKVERLARDLSTLTVREATAVVGLMNLRYGRTTAAAVVALLGIGVDNPTEAGDALVGKLQLVSNGQKKISVIKVLREHLRIGLKEAKDISDSVPIALNVTAAQTEPLANALRAAGATVTVQW